MLVRISPPILTIESQQDAFVMFRLYDSKTNQTIKFTSLFLFISKDGKLLMPPDLFHSREGILILRIDPTPGETTIYANKEPYLDAWEADLGGVIKLKGPILLEGGLYQIHVEIFGIDYPRSIFEPDKVPKFDVYLSVGDIYHQTVQHESQSYNMTIISYYDKVNGVSFDSGKKELVWTMPFNYNITRIKNEPDIFIHEEVRIPRNFTELASGLRFAGTLDESQLDHASILVDPYSPGPELIVHFLINKDQIIQSVEQSPQINTTGSMKFTLSPGRSDETSTIMFTDTGVLSVSLMWNPGQLAANREIELGLKFNDQFTGDPVKGDVRYDFIILDQDGNIVVNKENATAKSGSDTQILEFPRNETYHLEVEVQEIYDVSSGAVVPDPSRAGKATGSVVVPEFSALATLAIAVALLATVIILPRFDKQVRK